MIAKSFSAGSRGHSGAHRLKKRRSEACLYAVNQASELPRKSKAIAHLYIMPAVMLPTTWISPATIATRKTAVTTSQMKPITRSWRVVISEAPI